MNPYSPTLFYLFICLFFFVLNCIVHCVFVIKVKGEGEESFLWVLFGRMSVSDERQFSLGLQGRQVNVSFLVTRPAS